MKELKRIVEDIQSVFAQSSYPQAFLDAYDQMECLASHSGRETFLVQRKDTGVQAIAKCYDRTLFPFQPDYSFLNDLDHPGLPKFYETFHNDRMLCIVREYIEGEPLSDRAREEEMSLAQILSIADQLCGILEALHGHQPPIIHRDIKPENVILRPDGSIALIDFDIARSFKEHGASDTVFFGTKGYAPPEQYGFGQTDCRADIYALGVLLRWLITGGIRENKNIAIHPDIKRVIDRCTTFSPDERYADAGQVRKDLRAVRIRKPGFSAKTLWLFAVTAVIFLCAGFVLGRFTDVGRVTPAITFSEPLIERAVRLQLDKEKGPLSAEDLAKITRIYIYGSEAYKEPEQYQRQKVDEHAEGPIRTLDDLAMLENLRELFIARQGYVDVSGLASLTHTESVELKHVRISGVQPIARLSRLKNVVLFDSGVMDVTALEACPWLEELGIGYNDITSLTAVGSHPNIRTLEMMWLKLNDLSGLGQRMPHLQTLSIKHTAIRDLSGLKDIPMLDTVIVLPEQEEAVRTVLSERPEVLVLVEEN